MGSHSLTRPSDEPEASVLPSAENFSTQTAFCSAGRSAMKLPVRGSQGLICPESSGFFQSAEPAARIVPSGENARAAAGPFSLRSVARTDFVLVSQSWTSPFSQPTASVWPSGA